MDILKMCMRLADDISFLFLKYVYLNFSPKNE